MRINGSMYGRLIPLTSLGDARRQTAGDLPGYRTAARTNSVGLPNYLGGWFRLQNGSKALVFLTDASCTVIAPTTEGYSLLVSLEDSDGLVSALASLKSMQAGGTDRRGGSISHLPSPAPPH
jgi:hypothetical protein